jgi:hypothetical protein
LRPRRLTNTNFRYKNLMLEATSLGRKLPE